MEDMDPEGSHVIPIAEMDASASVRHRGGARVPCRVGCIANVLELDRSVDAGRLVPRLCGKRPGLTGASQAEPQG